MLTLLLASLACFRLTRLFTDDKITDEIRRLIVRKTPPPAKAKVKEGVTCPFCVSFYFALAISIYLVPIGELEPVAAVLWMPAIWGLSVIWNQLFVFLTPKT